MKIAFWILLFIVFYTFVGYAIFLRIVLIFKRLFRTKQADVTPRAADLPRVCLFVTAYNERDFVEAKVANLRELSYPVDKLQYVWVTDGSDDGTPSLLAQYPEMEVYHLPERRGKIHAMNRGMQFVNAPIVVFSDSNTMLCKDAVKIIVDAFDNQEVGCIAGEKRIADLKVDGAAGAGENIYWKYESWIKQMDSELNSAIGAAGELFAVRTALFAEVEPDTILDDFIISLRIAMQGYRIAYTPNAYAIESASASVAEELKRKVRIAAGGVQTISRLKGLLNPFRYGLLSVQYFSHKVLRWTLAPLALFALPFVNFFIVLDSGQWDANHFYSIFLYFQLSMYLLALLGCLFGHRKLRIKFIFVPYYFVAMNYASILGMLRWMKGKQPVSWEKSKRAE